MGHSGGLKKFKQMIIARQNKFIFNRINKKIRKRKGKLANNSIWYYLKLQIPIMHRVFFE